MQDVGILLSGGLDSAILAAMLKKENYNVHAYTFDQANSPLFAKRICNILNIKYNQININVTNDRLEIFRAVEYLENHRLSKDMKVYVAITNVPPQFKPSLKDEIPVRPSRKKIEKHPWILAPYADFSKKDVLKLGLDNVEEIDELIKVSHSCYMTSGTKCNKCFNCEERAWAFSELNIVDTGKY